VALDRVGHLPAKRARGVEPAAGRTGLAVNPRDRRLVSLVGHGDALAASATGTDRPFDLILCASLDRIARKPAELEARCSLARRNELAIVSAKELPDCLRPCSAWARRFTREIIINANGYGNHRMPDIGEPARRIRERKVRRRPAGGTAFPLYPTIPERRGNAGGQET
jgi:hypothetical protein